MVGAGNPESGANTQMMPNTFHIVDTTNTTSSITYDVRCRGQGNTFAVGQNRNPDNIQNRPCGISTITLMEIGA
mgnify:FL=1